jgi:methylmalonyl-CoA mutase
MTMNGAVLPVLAFYIVAAEEQGVTPEQLTGTIQNDILKEYLCRNTYIYPPNLQCASSPTSSPGVPPICRASIPSVSAVITWEAGANCVQQVAFTLADGIEYIKAALSCRTEN